MGGQIRERVTGSDIFREVQVELNRSGGYRVFFLSSTEATLAAIRQRLAQDYPHIQIGLPLTEDFMRIEEIVGAEIQISKRMDGKMQERILRGKPTNPRALVSGMLLTG